MGRPVPELLNVRELVAGNYVIQEQMREEDNYQRSSGCGTARNTAIIRYYQSVLAVKGATPTRQTAGREKPPLLIAKYQDTTEVAQECRL